MLDLIQKIAKKLEKEPTTYVVQRGDTLWKIAKNLLGRGGRWTEIASLNGISGTMIHNRQVLKIPVA